MNPIQKFFANIQANRENKKTEKKTYIKYKQFVQAMSEAGHDVSILQPEVMDEIISGLKQPDENNYKTYATQIEKIYKMYYGEAKYGGELLRGLIDIQTALLCGEGINVPVFDSPEFLEKQRENDKKVIDPLIEEEPQEEEKDEKKEAVKLFIDNLMEWNHLEGEGLIEIGECINKEGKVLVVLQYRLDGEEGRIDFEVFDYYSNEYTIERKNGKNIQVKYTDSEGNDQTIPEDRFVFMQFSGSKNDCVKTPPKIANVLTQIENYSRAKYDLRKNNHFFAKTFLWFKTENENDANSIKADLTSQQFKTGKSGAGSAEPIVISLSGGASEAINQERIMDIKDISTTMSLPIFFLSYPELMSNRSTAETMMEVVNQGTKKERLILQSGMKEAIQKSMKLAVDKNIKGAIYEPDSFNVNIPLITMDTLKQLNEVFVPLMDKKLISKMFVQGRIPSINPLEENKQIKEETKDNIINNPIVNGAVNEVMKQKADDNKEEQQNENIIS
jgi:hypothetical protein